MSRTKFEYARHFNPLLARQSRFQKLDRNSGLNLSSNELHHPSLPFLTEKFVALYISNDDFNCYPVISEKVRLQLSQQWGLAEDMIALAPGSDPGIRILLESLGSSQRLLVRRPCYRAFAEYADAQGIQVISIGPKRNCVLEIADSVRGASPCLIALENPDGITGECFNLQDIEYLAEFSACHGSFLLIDEAYGAFAPINHTRLVREHDNLVVMRSFSKSHGAAGLRIAAIFGHPRVVEQIRKAKAFNSVSSLALKYLGFMFDHRSDFEHIAYDVGNWRRRYEAWVERTFPNWECFVSNANFLAINMQSRTEAIEISEKLRRNGVYIRAVIDECLDRPILRLSVAHPDVLEPVLYMMREIV